MPKLITMLLQPVKDRGSLENCSGDRLSFSFFEVSNCTALASVPFVAELCTSETDLGVH